MKIARSDRLLLFAFVGITSINTISLINDPIPLSFLTSFNLTVFIGVILFWGIIETISTIRDIRNIKLRSKK